jgi:putative phosphoesterase
MPAAERLALLGDVHANLAALRAVLAHVAGTGIERGVITGDLVMRGGEPEECVAEVRRAGWPCVLGNTDRKVAVRPRRDPDHPKARRPGSRSWTTNRLSDESLLFLAALPLVVRVPLGPATVAVMHGSPTDPNGAIGANSSDRALALLAEELGADCIVSGHTHEPLVRKAAGCLFVNPGSVGEAAAGDLRPSWAWLEARRSGLRAHLERATERVARVRLA